MFKVRIGKAWVKQAFPGLESVDLYLDANEDKAGFLDERSVEYLKSTFGDEIVEVYRYEKVKEEKK